MLFLENSNPKHGTYDTFWESGAMTLTTVIIVVNCKMYFFQKRWQMAHILVILASVLSWWAIAYICTSVTLIDYEWYHIWNRLMYNGSFWLGMLLLVCGIIGKDILVEGLSREIAPTQEQIVQEVLVRCIMVYGMHTSNM